MKNVVEVRSVRGLRFRALGDSKGNGAGALAPKSGKVAMLEPETYIICPPRFVVVALAATLTGLTQKSIRRRIEDQVWIHGKEYRRSPDGRIFVDLNGVGRWVEKTG